VDADRATPIATIADLSNPYPIRHGAAILRSHSHELENLMQPQREN
jgi:hypothetical protein